ncbi:hypothetical protein RV032_003698 [Vibrio cholerae]|uniref:hypothetical protein n=1 Tax=Vibrio cholerae TaxID=666 RepID=UPI001DE7133D|nr:hypothetical protein [Vibrio cholerae]EGR4126224.1 hypothetical protein [Vibrio cholerae]EJL6560493.1 hypothetical protein [Vibrio cholerae]ELB7342612.1 hypothetical protein [Vibrio cholerae]ELC9568422.1 hypothetical protein [Vibrio cholerae]ELK8283797.1 hypothetical protein [Vibrio cholerae]
MSKILTIILSLVSMSVFANALDYEIRNDQFHTSEGMIPAGCLAQFKTELNGDNSVASIYVNRNSLRGCSASNIPFPGGDDTKIEYQIIEKLNSNIFKIRVCEEIQGSMGLDCDKILIQFANRLYVTPKESMYVLSIEKVGEW